MGTTAKRNPLVTVIMPVYNVGSYIGEAIESLLSQTMPDFELLIINDGSVDESRSMIESYQKIDPRIRLISRENRGLVPTIDEGLKEATGKFVARMDGDDISLPTRLEEQLDFLNTHEQYALVGTFTRKINEDDHIEGIHPRPTSNNNLRLFMAYGCALAGATILARRELFERFGGFDTNSWPAEDYDLWARIAIQDKKLLVFNLPKALYLYRQNNQGISATNQGIQKQKTAEIGERYRRDFLESKRKFISSLIHREWLRDVNNLQTAAEKEDLMRVYYELQSSFIHDQKLYGQRIRSFCNLSKLFILTLIYNRKNMHLLAQEFTE